MIQLMKSRLFPEKMDILYQKPFTPQTLQEDFEIKGGKWLVDDDGWLIGENRESSAAMIFSRNEYFGDVFIEFDAATILPATRDINLSWHASWDEKNNQRGVAYVMGIEGWWQGMVGFEKSPDYTFLVQTKLFPFEPGRVYHIAVGNIGNDLFLAIDGVLALEIHDPDPIDLEKYGLIGFEAFCTRVKYKNLCIRRAVAQPCFQPYEPEF